MVHSVQPPAVGQPLGQATILQLSAGGKGRSPEVDALGAAFSPFHALKARQGRNNGRRSHEHEKNCGDEEIVHKQAPSDPLVLRMQDAGESLQPRRE